MIWYSFSNFRAFTRTYVSEAKEAVSLEPEDIVDIRPRTVQEIMSGMSASQGHFLMGPASDAVDAAVATALAVGVVQRHLQRVLRLGGQQFR